MNTIRTIILSFVILIFPLISMAQSKKVYVVSTGDTTRVVNTINAGLKDPSSRFLFRKPNVAVDTIYSDLKSNYHSLEEATLDINSLLNDIEKEQTLMKPGDNSLSFRLSKNIVENVKKERAAKYAADSILAYERNSVQEMTTDFIEMDNKPTYYINGIQVSSNVADQLISGDIVKRELKVGNIISGNPNGEVWYLITDKAAQRIKINSAQNNIARDKTYSPKAKPVESATIQKNAKNVVKGQSKEAPNTQKVVLAARPVPLPANAIVSDSLYSKPKDSRTRIISRTVNNIEIQVTE